jgi:hypothetical protein
VVPESTGAFGSSGAKSWQPESSPHNNITFVPRMTLFSADFERDATTLCIGLFDIYLQNRTRGIEMPG